MESLVYYSLLSLLFILTLTFILLQNQSRRLRNLPPGPPTIPVIGNLHHLKPPIHRTFTALSHKYGDIMSLWFGSRLVIVVSSPSLVQECFNKNDLVLANRPRFLTGKYIFYNYSTVGSVSYGEHWRNLRRITTIDVLSNHRLNSFLAIRTDEANRLVQKLSQDITTAGSGSGFAKVELRCRLTEMSFNAVMRMISGKRYYGDDTDATDVEEARQFREIVSEMHSLMGANNKGDFLPLLRLFDFDGLEKRLKSIAKRADAFLQGLIEEHRSGKHRRGGGHDSMIEHLLKLQESQPEYYSDLMIKGLIQSMLLAGTDTSAVTIEWVMSELLNHPQVLKKAKNELDTQIGKDQLVQEQDLSKLPYLQNIISETFRLHPPAPLLLPHYSSEDCTVGGYNIPKDTIVLTNAFLIHRDPKYWSDATNFKPERFDKEGEINKLIAFGLGRRACPGMSLAQRTVGLTAGLLVQCFEWERETEEKLEMREDKGITMPMLVPFQALCKVR
ncbi:isoflavone 3'-hydroxylase-like [Lotus japonicus]|uniref:isoflavone 3'-hydroxylase-like n=1 Tax=Lotus japonicus TaxID=34305 RepID=UPI002590B131|nr:isoflavone 3'-hydroxylase-like [Lotus japonicus]